VQHECLPVLIGSATDPATIEKTVAGHDALLSA
jgi:hypothetical protein